MEKPFSAYTGSEDYVFVCYAHSDAEDVYSDLLQLNDAGVNIWYDEGIPAGKSWRGEIANAIKGARRFIYYISAASLRSNHCLREVDYALKHDIEIIPVYLEEATLPPELDLVLGRVQAISRKNDSRYLERLLAAQQAGATHTAYKVYKNNKALRWLVPIIIVVGIISYRLLITWDETAVSSPEISSVSPAQPDAFDLYLNATDLIELWALDDNLDQAIDLLNQSIRLDDDFALGFAWLAEALRIKYALTGDNGFLEEAVANAGRAMDLGPRLAPVQVVSGRIQAIQGNYDLAFAALEQALAIDPNNALANQAMASLYNTLGRTDDAEEAFRRAISLEPDNLFILDGFGSFLYSQGRYEEAIEQWRRVIRQAPDYYSVLVNMGSALDALGRLSEAIVMYERANAVQPTYMATSNLGSVYLGMGRYDEAIEALREAMEINSEDWLAWGNLAYAYAWKGDSDEMANEAFRRAIELAETAREESPRDPFVHLDLGQYYAKTGQEELALQRLESALVLAPDLMDVHAAGTEIHEVLGQRDQAIESFRSALRLGYPVQKFYRNPELSDFLEDPAVDDVL